MSAETEQRTSHWPISILSSIAALFNMALPLFLVRLLTPEEVGVFKIFFLYLLVMPTVSLSVGLTNGLAYWSGRGQQGQEAVKQTALLLLLLALTVSCLGWALRAPLIAAFGWSEAVFSVFLLSIFAFICSLFFEEAAICRGRIWLGAIFYSGFELLRTVAMVVTAYIYRDLLAVFAVFALIISIKAVIGYLLGFKLGLVGLALDRKTLWALARYALPVALAGLLSIPVNYADQLILSTYVSADQFALYTIGCLAIPPIMILEHSATRVLIPQMSEAFAAADPWRAAQLYRKTVQQLAFLIIPAVFGLFVFAQPIIDLLFTDQYSLAAGYLQLFAFNYLMLIFPNDVVPRARGEGGWILKNFTIFSVLALIFCLLMVREFGAFGALAAILLARGAMRVYGVLYIRTSTGLEFKDYLPLAALGRFFLVALLLSLLSFALAPIFASQLIWLLLCAPLFALLYLATFFVWKNRPVRVGSDKPALLIISQYLRIGGLERMILSLATNLKRKGWMVIVFCYDGVEFEGNRGVIPEFEKEGIQVIGLQKKSGFSWYVVWRLIGLIIRNNIELVHTHDLGALIYGSFAKLFSPLRVRLVHTQHSWVYIRRRLRDCWYQKKFSIFADQLVAVSEGNRAGFGEVGINTERVVVIENGVEVPKCPDVKIDKRTVKESFLQQEKESTQSQLAPYLNDVWILYLARFDQVKGQGHALEIWSRLSVAARKKAVLLFVGPGKTLSYFKKFCALRDNSPDSERLLIPGETNSPAKWQCASDLFLSCSEFEGLPLGPLEAMANGVPALISEIRGHAFLHGRCRHFKLDDLEGAADQLEQLIVAVDKGERRLANDLLLAYQWVAENYSVERMTVQYEKLYLKLAGSS